MKVAVVLVVAMIMMMGQEAESWRYWRRTVLPNFPTLRMLRRWGKREVRDAEFDAALNAAVEDGILSDDEIQSVLGFSAEDLTKFKEIFDKDENGQENGQAV